MIKVKFNSKEDVNDFLDVCCEYKFDIDACCGRYTVDAKRLLGLLSIGLGATLTIVLHTDKDKKIAKFCTQIERWRVD